MDDDAIWAAIDRQRLRTTDMLAQLSEDEWRQPSLCNGWTVRDVAAHLTFQQISLGDALINTMRHPGGINRIIRDAARRRAAQLPSEQIIAQIRAMVGSRRHAIGVTCRETLIDNLVHSQDIAMPLGRPIDIAPETAAVAASRVWSYGRGWMARVFNTVPLDGMRFSATDTTWSAGHGADITGPMTDILLVLTGRFTALPGLSGPGLDAMKTRVTDPGPNAARQRRPAD
jgi:uncharacterized protein (TIGR03083 family)